jgi:putative transposase
MVRAGVVRHPSEWPFCGYNEIQEPKRKKVLINYQRLTELLGFDSYDEVKKYHKSWVDDYLGNGKNVRDDKWTKSIAVGNKSFVERVKSLMGVLAIGRKSIEAGESFQLREPAVPCGAHFEDEKGDIGPKNTYFWDDIQ